MKTTRTILLIFGLVGIIIGVYLSIDDEGVVSSNSAIKTDTTKRESHHLDGRPVASKGTLPFTPPDFSKSDVDTAQELVNARLMLNVPIAFYGKVVDQNLEPLAGVDVRLRYREYLQLAPEVSSESYKTIELVTDSDGTFAITDAMGDFVRVMDIKKRGYRLSTKTQFGYPYTVQSPVPEPSSPVLFRMWKLQGADRLVFEDKFYGIIPDGRTYTLDFLAHKKIEADVNEGDLKVSIQRPETVEPRTNFDWSFTIEVIDGGLVETTDEFMFLAPDSGYKPRYEVNMDATDPNWSSRVKKQFYVLSRERKLYSRMEVEVIAKYRDQSVFSVKYFVNPTGSRNLEFDPRQYTSTANHFPPE